MVDWETLTGIPSDEFDYDYEMPGRAFPGGGRKHKPKMHVCTRENGKRCSYCGCTGLRWKKTEWGYRLFDMDGNLHACKGRRKK